MGLTIRLARKLRLPVAGLGLFMVWSAVFASDVVRPWMTNTLWWIATLQGGTAIVLWLGTALDAAGRPRPHFRDELDGDPGEGGTLRRWVGRSPVGWAVLAFGLLGAPDLAARAQQPAIGGLGWTWAMLYCAVTLVSNRVDPKES